MENISPPKQLLYGMIVVLALLAGPLRPHVQAQNFYSYGGVVPNNTINTLANQFTQTVSGVGNLTGSNKLTEVCLSISQPIPADIDIYLTSPAGTTVRLSDDNGGSSGNDYHTGICFTECGPSGSIIGANDFKGVYLPEQSLSAFNNGQNPNGTWTLRVDDDAATGGNGTLNFWSLDFGTATMPAAPNGRVCASAYALTTLPYVHPCMTLASAGNDYADNACNAHYDGAEYIYTYVPTTADEFLSIDISQDFAAPSGFPTVSLLNACPSVALPINCLATEIQFSSTENINHITSQPLTIGVTYYIVVSSTSGTGGIYDMKIAMGRNGSTNCLTATNITSQGEYAGNNYNAPAPNLLAPSTAEMTCNGSIDNFIFYTFTTDGSGNTVHASITDIACNLSCGGACGIQVALFRAPVGGACQGPGTWGAPVFCGSSTLTNAYYDWPALLPNTQYYLMVDGTAGSQCVWNLRLLGGIQQIPLPVTMTDFGVKTLGEANHLSWKTTQEINVDRFEVEHGMSVMDFTKVGTVSAQGNSALVHPYSFDDGNVEPGWHYYRLKTIDRNGESSYTGIERVLVEANGDYYGLFPNPAQGQLNLKFMANGERNVQILGLDGRLWKQWTLNAMGDLETQAIDISDLAPRVYLLQVLASSGAPRVMKFVKL